MSVLLDFKRLLRWKHFCNVRGVGLDVRLIDKQKQNIELYYTDNISFQNGWEELDTIKTDWSLVDVVLQDIGECEQKKLFQNFERDLSYLLPSWLESLNYNFQIKKEDGYPIFYFSKNTENVENPQVDELIDFLTIIEKQEKQIGFSDNVKDLITASSETLNKIFLTMMCIESCDSENRYAYVNVVKDTMIEFWNNLPFDDEKVYVAIDNLAYFKTFIPHEVWADKRVKDSVLEACERFSYTEEMVKEKFPYFLNSPFLIKYSEKPKFSMEFNEGDKIAYLGSLKISLTSLDNYLTPDRSVEFIKLFYEYFNSNPAISPSITPEVQKKCLKNLLCLLLDRDDVENIQDCFHVFKKDTGVPMVARKSDVVFDAARGNCGENKEIVITFEIKREVDETLKQENKFKIKNNLLEFFDIVSTSGLTPLKLLSNKNVINSLSLERKLEDEIPVNSGSSIKAMKF